MATLKAEKPFNLIRWFSILCLVTIGVVCVATSVFLSRFLTEHMLRHDAEVTMGFVESIAKVQKAAGYFAGRQPGDSNWEEFFSHLDDMPDVLRINAYAKDGKVIWSSDKLLIGKKFDDNDELEDALKGKLVVDSGITSKEPLPKAEHIHLSDVPIPYVENYIPIRDITDGEVIGVVELYRSPRALYETIATGKRYIWLGGICSGLLLFAMLFWIMRRASRTIAKQQEQIVQSETIATIGELSGAVAHSIRNPLASIRSCAELIHDDSSGVNKEAADDIINEVDRVENWIRELLNYARPISETIKNECLNTIIKDSIVSYQREMGKRQITTSIELADKLPSVQGNEPLLKQAINNLITNAVQAMPDGGHLVISSLIGAGPSVQVKVADNGIGISPQQLATLFKPFQTSKPNGLGLGLPFVKRIVERHGGKVEVDSKPGRGTTVLLSFPAAN